MKQALIIAGGKGTRLSSRLKDIPKPLVDFNGKPLLFHQLNILKSHGFNNILILAGYKSDKIHQYIKSNNDFGLKIKIVTENKPLGTGGAILSAYKYLEKTFLVVYGDTIFDIDLKRFLQFHKRSKKDISLFVHPNDHPHDSDIIEVDDKNNVIALHPYPHKSKKYLKNLVNAALYMIQKESLLKVLEKKIKFSDFFKDLLPKLLQLGTRITAYNSPEYIKDCGTPARLDQAINDFKEGKIGGSNLSVPQNTIFIDRDGTLNIEVGHLSDENKLKLINGADKAIKLINKSKYRCIVITNQPVIARGECSFDQLQNIHNKLETILGKSSAYIAVSYTHLTLPTKRIV